MQKHMWGQNEMDGQKERITEAEKTKERSEMFCDFRNFSLSQGMYRQKPLVRYHA
jgi:hypothetical protein